MSLRCGRQSLPSGEASDLGGFSSVKKARMVLHGHQKHSGQSLAEHIKFVTILVAKHVKR